MRTRFTFAHAHKKERKKRACVLKKACGNHWSVFLIRVRAPGEETQGIRPPFLNFFMYICVFLSFNACVINLSLSLSGSF